MARVPVLCQYNSSQPSSVPHPQDTRTPASLSCPRGGLSVNLLIAKALQTAFFLTCEHGRNPKRVLASFFLQTGVERQGYESSNSPFSKSVLRLRHGERPLADRCQPPFPIGLDRHYRRKRVRKEQRCCSWRSASWSRSRGRVQSLAEAVYCPQRTDKPPPFFDALLDTTNGYAQRLKGQLEVAETWRGRWHTLSHGERKRAQIGVALWRRPQILAIDEPTNHLDAAARDLLITALQSFQGVGLLVSHDRALLDTLCQQCVFIDPPQAVLRPGGFSQGSRQAKAEAQRADKQYVHAKRERQRIEREARRRRAAAAQAHHKRSKRGLAKKDHDARGRKNLARATGKDGVGGKLLRQLDVRLDRARHKQEAISVTKTSALGIWMPGAQSKRATLFSLPACRLPLGPERWLHVPGLTMRPDDRIALTGANGSGKSTVIARLIKSVDLPPERVTYIPQEIPRQQAEDIVKPDAELGKRSSEDSS